VKFINQVPIEKGSIMIRTIKPGIVGEGEITNCEKTNEVNGNNTWVVNWEPTKIFTVKKE